MCRTIWLRANAPLSEISRPLSFVPSSNVRKIWAPIIVQKIAFQPMTVRHAYQLTKMSPISVVPSKFVVCFLYPLEAISQLQNLTLNFTIDQKEIASLPECFHDDNVYHLGEKFEPSSHPCYECMCTLDFDNATAVAVNANCAKIDCGIEIREAKHVRDGCTPIYYGRERCCPIDFRCRKCNRQASKNRTY